MIIVTGAAGGIGAATLARLGDDAVGVDLRDGFDVTDPAA